MSAPPSVSFAFSTRLTPTSGKTIINRFLAPRCLLKVQVLLKAKKIHTLRCVFFWSRRQDTYASHLSCSPTESFAFSTRLAPTSGKTIINRFLAPRCLLKVQVLLKAKKIHTLWCVFFWSRRQDLNLRHLAPKASTLPN